MANIKTIALLTIAIFAAILVVSRFTDLSLPTALIIAAFTSVLAGLAQTLTSASRRDKRR